MFLSFLFHPRPKAEEKAPVIERKGICENCTSLGNCPSDCFFKSRY